jgi:renalase
MSHDLRGTLDAVVVGAGIAGLTCARDLISGGWNVLVVEKSRAVGGRCATRRMLGQPVDIGLSYYHADDPDLLAELAAVPATHLPGWPHVVTGPGAPCHPATFRAGQQRLAFAEGVNAFPKHLARDVPVRFSSRVVGIRPLPDGVELGFEDDAPLRARNLVLAIPPHQAEALLPHEQGISLRAVETLFKTISTAPCITVSVGYSTSAPAPAFDIMYPGEHSILRLISHDSTKRTDPDFRVLVLQARAGWSQTHLEENRDAWPQPLIEAAAQLVGDWVRAPEWADPQRWRFAKLVLPTEMSAPLVFGLPGGARLGLTGEAFALEAGVQGAYRAGRGLARRMLADGAEH